MPTETPYQRLKREQASAPREEKVPALQPRVSPEVRRARKLERGRRNMEARRRAFLVLAQRHPEEFRALLDEELAGVNAERGVLPGDES